jgi:hypothetical protein
VLSRELAPALHIPWTMPFQLDDPPIVPTTVGTYGYLLWKKIDTGTVLYNVLVIVADFYTVVDFFGRFSKTFAFKI